MNTKLKEAMEYMDQKHIDEAVEYKAKTRSSKPLLRWGALAACLVLVVSLSFGFYRQRPTVTNPTETNAVPTAPPTTQLPTTPLPTEPAKPVVLPPTRYGTLQSQSYLSKSYSLYDGIEEATAIAWIRVGNWIGEANTSALGKTYFEAEVVECYTGSLPDSFVLKQYGSSFATELEFPLLTHGNELLVLLKYSETDVTFGACYYILGSYSTVMDVVTASDGTVYVSDRMGIVTRGVPLRNYAGNTTLVQHLSAVTAKKDEIQGVFIDSTSHLFVLEDIVNIITK